MSNFCSSEPSLLGSGTSKECWVFVLELAVADLYTIVKQHTADLPLVLARRWTSCILLAIDFMQNGRHSPGLCCCAFLVSFTWSVLLSLSSPAQISLSEVAQWQDIKTSKVLIFADKMAKVCDFSLAHHAEAGYSSNKALDVNSKLITLCSAISNCQCPCCSRRRKKPTKF